MKHYTVWYEGKAGGYAYLFISDVPGKDVAERIRKALEEDFPTHAGDHPGVHRAWIEED